MNNKAIIRLLTALIIILIIVGGGWIATTIISSFKESSNNYPYLNSSNMFLRNMNTNRKNKPDILIYLKASALQSGEILSFERGESYEIDGDFNEGDFVYKFNSTQEGIESAILTMRYNCVMDDTYHNERCKHLPTITLPVAVSNREGKSDFCYVWTNNWETRNDPCIIISPDKIINNSDGKLLDLIKNTDPDSGLTGERDTRANISNFWAGSKRKIQINRGSSIIQNKIVIVDSVDKNLNIR